MEHRQAAYESVNQMDTKYVESDPDQYALQFLDSTDEYLTQMDSLSTILRQVKFPIPFNLTPKYYSELIKSILLIWLYREDTSCYSIIFR